MLIFYFSYDDPFKRPKCKESKESCLLKVQPYAHNPRKNGLEPEPSDDDNDRDEVWGTTASTPRGQKYRTPNPLFSSGSPFSDTFCCGGSPCGVQARERPKSTSPTRSCPCDPNQKVSYCKKHGIRYKNRPTDQSQQQDLEEAGFKRIRDNKNENQAQINKRSSSLSPKCKPCKKC